MRHMCQAAAFCLLTACAVLGQEVTPAPAQQSSPPQQDGAVQSPAPKPADPAPDGVAPQPPALNPIDKRVFGVLPNNRTTSGMVPFQKISAGHKIKIALKDSFDWPSYLTGSLFAGLY